MARLEPMERLGRVRSQVNLIGEGVCPMTLQDPVAAYTSESNEEALLVQRFLENEGIEAFVIEDHSLVGYWMLGTLAEIHKPQVWVNRNDSARVAELLVEYERRRLER